MDRSTSKAEAFPNRKPELHRYKCSIIHCCSYGEEYLNDLSKKYTEKNPKS